MKRKKAYRGKLRLLIPLFLFLSLKIYAQEPGPYGVEGKVVSATDHSPLPGATVQVKGSQLGANTGDDGIFAISGLDSNVVLSVSFIGYKAQELELRLPLTNSLTIVLEHDAEQLDQVTVSTGYETIPKERATGSFVQIDNELFNRGVSPDVLNRLKGITNGLLFDNPSSTGNTLGISVRGRSTLFSETTPLIVVDNFPFEGDISTLNPNDILSVTILKDAASASIWGVRSGNGVIVIKTRKGRTGQAPSISFNTNFTIGDEPDLYYESQLTSAEYIEVEKFLFQKGFYNPALNSEYRLISPVVEILQKLKEQEITERHANTQIDKLRQNNVREQLEDYFFRKSIRQQYHLNITGGGKNQTYYFSGGYDRHASNSVGLSDDRFTLKGSNTYMLLNNRLKVSADLTFTNSRTSDANNYEYTPYMPYAQIADKDGNALPVLRTGGLRAAYTDTAGAGNLLNWKYKPLDELRNSLAQNNRNETDYRLNLSTSYQILAPLSISANYQYYRASREGLTYYDPDSFYTRNLINTYSQIDWNQGDVLRQVPLGGILNTSNTALRSNYGRIQISFNKDLSDKHEVNAIAGYEMREDFFETGSHRLYGFDPETATSVAVNYTDLFDYYWQAGSNRIGRNVFNTQTNDRYISYYANASYVYGDRYILSGSIREDQSNLFGVKSSQQGVPLWSIGLAWNIQSERFFDISWLSVLKLRGTYGYNGNVNKSVSAYLTAEPAAYLNPWDTKFYKIDNPPNSALRWERVQNANFGFDFSVFNNRLTGSFEYYIKNGQDLIGESPIAPQTGISDFTGNTANTHAKGLDIQVNALPVNGTFQWSTTVIFNYVKDEVTDYKANIGTNSRIVASNQISPLVGYPINSIFAFRWGGLDTAGNPQAIYNGTKSKDYTAILNSMDREAFEHYGTAVPTFFGALRNTISYKFIELSFNVTYKLGYYFRRPSINYFHLYGGNYKQPDFDKRWKIPSDEFLTDVPSMIYPVNLNREEFYAGSSILVEEGDHVRLQDVQLNFNFSKSLIRTLPVSNLNLYVYATNLNILLWKANSYGFDPDVRFGYPSPQTIAFGIEANF